MRTQRSSFTPSNSFVKETTKMQSSQLKRQGLVGLQQLQPISTPSTSLGRTERLQSQIDGLLVTQSLNIGSSALGDSAFVPKSLVSTPQKTPTRSSGTALTIKLVEQERKRKGKHLVLKSAHWIEIQERTGDVCAKIFFRDLKKAARIKAQRKSKGPKMTSTSDQQWDSESS